MFVSHSHTCHPPPYLPPARQGLQPDTVPGHRQDEPLSERLEAHEGLGGGGHPCYCVAGRWQSGPCPASPAKGQCAWPAVGRLSGLLPAQSSQAGEEPLSPFGLSPACPVPPPIWAPLPSGPPSHLEPPPIWVPLPSGAHPHIPHPHIRRPGLVNIHHHTPGSRPIAGHRHLWKEVTCELRPKTSVTAA